MVARSFSLMFLMFWLTAACLTQSEKLHSGFFPVMGGKIYYEMIGVGHPLLLIHGGQLDSRMWDDQVKTWSNHYRVIRLDVRGYGKSSASTEPYASEEDAGSAPQVPSRGKSILLRTVTRWADLH